jgi:hypothetical protein
LLNYRLKGQRSVDQHSRKSGLFLSPSCSSFSEAPQRKHARSYSGGDDNAAFYDEAGDDEDFFAGYPVRILAFYSIVVS